MAAEKHNTSYRPGYVTLGNGKIVLSNTRRGDIPALIFAEALPRQAQEPNPEVGRVAFMNHAALVNMERMLSRIRHVHYEDNCVMDSSSRQQIKLRMRAHYPKVPTASLDAVVEQVFAELERMKILG